MTALPAHVSPELPAQGSNVARLHAQTIPDLELSDFDDRRLYQRSPPHELISPAFTPPATPGTGTPALQRDAQAFAVDSSQDAGTTAGPKLLDILPEVDCLVRARIPTTAGTEMFLHLYQNNLDNKEHLAIVFGPSIRSHSLDAPRPGETELDRMIRGAYTGRLYPGRQSSRFDSPQQKTATPPPSHSHSPAPGSPATTAARSHTEHPSAASVARHTAAAPPPPSSAEPKPPATIHQTPLVRIHSECYTGETVWSARCDCGEQLDEAARLMSLPHNRECGGVIVYLRQEGRGIGLGEKLKAYNLQDLGSDTVEANLLLRHPADARSYGLATAILCDLGLGGEEGIRLLTNNPDKIRAVEGPNREVVVKERVAMVPLAWAKGGGAGINSEEVGKYLRTKIERMGHMLQQG